MIVNPCPLQVIIVLVNILEAPVDGVGALHFLPLDCCQELLNRAERCDQSRHVYPVSGAAIGIRFHPVTDLRIRLENGPLKPLDHRVSYKLVDSHLVEGDAPPGSGDFHPHPFIGDDLLAVICINKYLQEIPSLHHLPHSKGAEKVVVDLVELLRVLAHITFRPFLGVADGTHRAQVDSRDQL